MFRMRWSVVALLCAASTVLSAQGDKPDSSKLKKVEKNTKVAVDKGAKDTKNAVVNGAKDTKNAVVTGAKDTKNAVVKGAKDTKKAVKKVVDKDSAKKKP
jgi:putative intracellular protease/amidase